MNCDHMDIITSQNTKKIKAYCHWLAKDLGLTMDLIWWGHALHPDHVEAPYYLHMHVTEPFDTVPEFWFTAQEIFGYGDDTTTEAIQSKIRQDLEIRRDNHHRYAV